MSNYKAAACSGCASGLPTAEYMCKPVHYYQRPNDIVIDHYACTAPTDQEYITALEAELRTAGEALETFLTAWPDLDKTSAALAQPHLNRLMKEGE